MMRNKVRAALVGVGAWGRVLAKAASKSSALEFVCCVGRNTERLAAFAREFEIAASDISSVLANKHIDAIVLAVPNERHLELAELAAQAGKHVFIEKPIANTMADGLRVAELESAHGVRIVVGHCARLLASDPCGSQMPEPMRVSFTPGIGRSEDYQPNASTRSKGPRGL